MERVVWRKGSGLPSPCELLIPPLIPTLLNTLPNHNPQHYSYHWYPANLHPYPLFSLSLVYLYLSTTYMFRPLQNSNVLYIPYPSLPTPFHYPTFYFTFHIHDPTPSTTFPHPPLLLPLSHTTHSHSLYALSSTQ